MKKLILIIFILTNLMIYSQDEILEISENSKIDSIGKKKISGSIMVLEDVVIDGVIINRIYTNIATKRSEIIITKEDLKKSFLENNKDIKELEINFAQDRIILDGKIKVLAVVMSMHLEGVFYVEKEEELWYNIDKARVNRFMPVPGSIIGEFETRLNPIFKFSQLGFPVYIKGLNIEKDKLIFR
ncbi:MAG: hypothetical protein ACQERZ_03525 [Fusobacteriota bacterium]